MKKYYTRACNFFYGNNSKQLIKEKLAFPLCGDNTIAFNKVEIFTKDKKKVNSKIVDINDIGKLPFIIKKKYQKILKKLYQKENLLEKKNISLWGF